MYKKKHGKQKVEYAGTIPFTLTNTRNYVKFNKPTETYKSTTRHRATDTRGFNSIHRVSHTTLSPKMTKHSSPTRVHPILRSMSIIIQPCRRIWSSRTKGTISLTSLKTNMKQNLTLVMSPENLIISWMVRNSKKVRVTWSDLVYIQTTPNQWKRVVNNFMDPIMRKEFGISVKYYTWDELGEITLLDRNVLMNIS